MNIKNELWRKVRNTYFSARMLSSLGHGWFAATYVIFLKAHGLSDTETMRVNALFMVISFILDPITGPLGDLIGQKRTYILGETIMVVSLIAYFFGNSANGFYLAEAIGAIGYALKSEALESWSRSSTDDSYHHGTITRGGSLARIAGIPSSLLGLSIANTYGYQWPWLLSALTAVVAVVILISRKSLPDSNAQKFSFSNVLGAYKGIFQSWRFFLTNKDIRFVGITLFLTNFLFQPINMLWQPILENRMGTISLLGWVWVGISIFGMIGSEISNKISKYDRSTIGYTVVSIGLPLLIGVAIGNKWTILGAVLVHQIGRIALHSLSWTLIDKDFETHNRFTMHSIKSSINSFGATMGLLSFGPLSDLIGQESTWIISGALLTLLGLTIIKLSGKTNE
jgi:MFS family permease